MGAPARCAVLLFAACAMTLPTAGDEIRLRDGKKLNGNIVGYEDNMFRVKTDFGYVLVEKDKVAEIIPSKPPTAKESPKPKETPEAKPEAKPETPEVKPATKKETSPEPAKRGPKTASAKKPGEVEKGTKPATPGGTTSSTGTPQPAAATSAAATAPAPAPAQPETPKIAELPPNREEVRGNEYINHTYGFSMYKAPGWNLIANARQALPNAIVAMGTSDETTLLVIGHEPLKEPLEKSAAAIEKQLGEVYENYRRLSQKKTQLSGVPAIEYEYRGVADGHDWSGRLVTVAWGTDVFTILGMTYADSELIQIQENVIAKAIASLNLQLPRAE